MFTGMGEANSPKNQMAGKLKVVEVLFAHLALSVFSGVSNKVNNCLMNDWA
jgi:hypothetical protein